VTLGRQEKVRWLQRVPLFDGCSGEVIERLADLTAEAPFADGEPIVRQGQVGNGLYIVLTGGVRVVGGTTELGRLGPGESFGELSVIDQQPRTATVLADGPTTCLALASWDLLGLIERDHHLALNLLRSLAARLRRADEQLRD
jgi:CRP/FNR family transcriptional regulator, cyclic AMP receptor protein